MPMLSIERRQIAAQPTLFVRLHTARQDLAATIGAGLGKAYGFAQSAGGALAGPPFVRYVATGPGLLTIEAGVPLAATMAGAGEVEAGELPGGPVLVALHGGAYDQLSQTYAAMERWAAEHGAAFAGAPWESYLTDPADHPDQGDWRTEVFWPLTK